MKRVKLFCSMNEHAENTVEKKINWKKRIIKAGIIMLALCSFLVCILFGLLWIYEKEIKQALIEKLNTYLTARVIIQPEDIQTTWLETFPDASIKFSNGSVLENSSSQKKDTIIQFKEIYFRFNLFNLIKNNYTINSIELKNTHCKLKTDKNGIHNFIFWDAKKSSTKISGEKHALNFSLEKIILKNIEIQYKNEKEELLINGKIQENRINGAFSDHSFLMSTNGIIYVENLLRGEKEYIKKKTFEYSTKIDIKNQNWSVNEINLQLNQLNLAINGKLNNNNDKIGCDLKLTGNNMDIQSILSLLPENQKNRIRDYSSEGNFYFTGKIKGYFDQLNDMNINLDFGIRNGIVKHLSSGTKLSNLKITGSYSHSTKNEELIISELSGEIGKNKISGKCRVNDFSDPFVEINSQINADISDIIAFYPIDTIEKVTGLININANLSGKIRDLEENYANQKIKTSGQASIKNLELIFKNSKMPIKIESGDLMIEQNDLKLKNVILIPDENRLTMNGQLMNFFAWLLKENETLTIQGDAEAENINAEQILNLFASSQIENHLEKSSNNNGTNQNTFSISKNLNLDFNVNFKRLNWGKFIAENTKGKINVEEGKLFSEGIQFSAFDGMIKFRGIAENTDQLLCVKGNTELTGINIQKLFYQLNNFGQELIQDKHLRGKATSVITFSTYFGKNFRFVPEKLVCESDVSLEKGELIDFKPLEALSKYIELSELKRIQFSSLTTHVLISNKTITLSKTEINNSALNIKISGKQDFDYNLNYRVSLLLSELLAKKPGKNKQLDEELRLVENDPENKRTVFLKMEGNIDNLKISYDKKSAREKIKEDFRNEGKNLKNILREEFGFLKKDTLSKQNKENLLLRKSDQKFGIELDSKKKEINSDDDDDF